MDQVFRITWLTTSCPCKDPRPASKTSSSSNTPLRDLSPSAPLNSLQGTRDGGVNPKLESNGSLKQAESVENLSHTSRRSSSRSRTNSDKLNPTTTDTADPTSKRPTWIRSLSSKFSSSQSPASNSPPNTQAKRAPSPSPAKPPRRETTSTFPEDGDDEHEEVLEPYVPQHPKGSSFFSSALRRLSSSAPSAATKSSSSGFVCPRQTLNVDKGRERCQIKDLDQKKLRRVAFSVDVEVAGVSRYMDEQSSTDTATKLREKKIKERSEGEALKTSHRPTGQHATGSEDSVIGNQERKDSGTSIDDIFENEMMAAAKQHETDAVNKRRIEKQDARRRSSEDALAAAAEAKTALGQNGAAAPTVKQPKPMAYPPRPQDRPTIDPLRMYRRCCQLREAPVLKRISEQLGASKPLEYETPGVVEVLDLNSSRMQLNDIICLADWLAIVPVKKLLLDHAGVTDESLRVVLAGLLAVKPPGFNKRKRETSSPTRHHEQKPNRTPGVIEKLSLKGNVKITAIGWKHLFLFMNMSRSIRSLDMSLTSFASSPAEASTLADLMYRSLVSRLGGSRFEELILSSCKLTSEAVCKIADAATVIGLNRLGLAKSQLDHKALHCIAKYIESGKCIGLDIGANDLGDPKSIMILTATLTSTNPFMYLSLANCNMSPASLDQLLPPLRVLPDFRFLDLSHNREIFTEHARALATLRKYIVQLRSLRRLHLVDVAMSPAQAIGIAEILPEVRNLNHISFMENPEIKALASATDLASQEDACALYASIMVACRVSKTLLAVDIDSPNAEANEVVSAMAKQVIAYCLRNVGRYTAADAMSSSDPASVIPDAVDPSLEVQQPDVLAHIVGDSNGSYPRQDGQGEIGPDQDYIVGGTGVVKALNYVLGQQTQDLRRVSLVNGPLDANSPIMDPSVGKRKARELSKSLLNSARQIRTRLHPAMLREAKKGDEMASRKLSKIQLQLPLLTILLRPSPIPRYHITRYY